MNALRRRILQETLASLSDLAAGDEVHVQPKAPKNAPTTFVARKISVENEQEED